MSNGVWKSIIGLIIMNFMSAGNQAGMVFMKLAFMQAEDPNRKSDRPGFLRCYWWVGLIFMLVCDGTSVILETWVPLVLCSSVQATGITAAVLMSIFWLKEKFYPKFDIPAIMIIIGGCLGLIFTANAQQETYTMDELKELIKSRQSVIYMSLAGICMATTILSTLMMFMYLVMFENDLDVYGKEQMYWLLDSPTTAGGPSSFRKSNRDNLNQTITSGATSQVRQSEIAEEQQQTTQLSPTNQTHQQKKPNCFCRIICTKRPVRPLIIAINEMSFGQVKKINPNGVCRNWVLKIFSKVPLLMFCISTGFLSGLCQACFKFAGLGVVAGKPVGSAYVLGFAFLGAVVATTQFSMINMVIKIYKQVDFGPIYESVANLMTVITGLVLFDEAKMYDSKQLGLIFMWIFIVSCGIFILAAKENFVDRQKKQAQFQKEEEDLLEENRNSIKDQGGVREGELETNIDMALIIETNNEMDKSKALDGDQKTTLAILNLKYR